MDAECPLCGNKGKVPDVFYGRQVKCRECCNLFTVGGPNAKPQQPIPASAVKKASGPSTMEINLGHPTPAPGTIPTPSRAAQKAAAGGSPFSNLESNGAPGKKVVSSPRPAKRKKSNKGRIILVSSVAGLIFLAMVGFAVKIILKGPRQIPDSTEVASGAKAGGTESNRGTSPGVQPANDWVDISKQPVRLGDSVISVFKINIDVVKGKDITSTDKFFQIVLKIENQSKTERLDYQGWGIDAPINRGHPPELTDDTERSYKCITFKHPAQVEGQLLAFSVMPGNFKYDVLVFEVPSSTAKYLHLELSGANLWGSGKVKMLIPSTMFVKAAVPPPMDPTKPPMDPTKPPMDPTKPPMDPVKPPMDPTKPPMDPTKPPMDPVKPPMGQVDPKTGESEPKAVKSLRVSIRKGTTPLRILSIEALGELGPTAVTATPDLIEFLRDPDAKIRQASAGALGSIGPKAQDATLALTSSLKQDKSEIVRLASAEALGKMGPEGVPGLVEGLKDEFWKVRAECAKGLGNLGPAAKEAIPSLLPLLKDKDQEVPQRVKEAIQKIDPTVKIPQ